MTRRAVGFASLLSVATISIVFGMMLGGHLNQPTVAGSEPVAMPAADVARPLSLAPANVSRSPFENPNGFADIIDRAVPAVVSVASTQSAGGDGGEPDLWNWFFRRDDEDDGTDNEGGERRERPLPQLGEGSGFVISEDGYILTNHHVIDDADEIRVGFHDGSQHRAALVGSDPAIDLALLKIETDEPLSTLPMGDSAALRVGEWVVAIGNPLEYEQTVTVGVLSAKRRRVPIGDTDRNGLVTFLQTDAAINFGNSGGPLLDAAGNVVGINTAITRNNYAEGIGFALPINQAKAVLEQLRDRGYVRRGYLGINMNQGGIDRNASEYFGLPDLNGVLIDDVTEGSPAASAGLRTDDVIRMLDGAPVRDNDDLISRISSRQPGDQVRLGVYRAGRDMQFTVELDPRATSGGRDEAAPRSEPQPARSMGLGIRIREATPGDLQGVGGTVGVVIAEVEFNSQAAEKALRRGDVITAVNDQPVTNVDAWHEILDALEPDQAIKINVTSQTPASRSSNRTFFLRSPR